MFSNNNSLVVQSDLCRNVNFEGHHRNLMRWLGRKSAIRWRREAHYCPILHCKSVQYSASERRRLADIWPINLIYDSDGGLKSWCFCICIRVVLNLDQKSYQWTLITYVLNNFCFLARVKFSFFYRKWIYADDRTCGTHVEYVCLENVSIRKTGFLAFETTPPLWFWFI